MRGLAWRWSHGCEELFAGLLTLIAQVIVNMQTKKKRQQSQQNLFKKESILIQKWRVEI